MMQPLFTGPASLREWSERLAFWITGLCAFPAALLIGVWFLIQLINAGSVADVQTGGVAYLAHVGGFIFGAVTSKLFERSSQSEQELEA